MIYEVDCKIPGVEDHTDLTVLEMEFHLLSQYFHYRHIKREAETAGDQFSASQAEWHISALEHQMRQWTRDLAWSL